MESLVQKNLRKELKRGMELARKLQLHLKASKEARELHRQILSSQGKALSMLNRRTFSMTKPHSIAHSPSAHNGSPHSDGFDLDFQQQEFKVKDASMKRYTIDVWEIYDVHKMEN